MTDSRSGPSLYLFIPDRKEVIQHCYGHGKSNSSQFEISSSSHKRDNLNFKNNNCYRLKSSNFKFLLGRYKEPIHLENQQITNKNQALIAFSYVNQNSEQPNSRCRDVSLYKIFPTNIEKLDQNIKILYDQTN